jgi:integrative and conjugative element protein (TIGR02256 family)
MAEIPEAPYPRGEAAVLLRNPLHVDAHVLIEPIVLDTIKRHRQRSFTSPEAGGILLGYRRGFHLHLVHATEPGKKDRMTRTSFRREDGSHAAHALALWRRTDHEIDYLGEWHTHPETSPQPSTIDRCAWQEILRKRAETFVFLIMGTESTFWAGCGIGREIRETDEATVEETLMAEDHR